MPRQNQTAAAEQAWANPDRCRMNDARARHVEGMDR